MFQHSRNMLSPKDQFAPTPPHARKSPKPLFRLCAAVVPTQNPARARLFTPARPHTPIAGTTSITHIYPNPQPSCGPGAYRAALEGDDEPLEFTSVTETLETARGSPRLNGRTTLNWLPNGTEAAPL